MLNRYLLSLASLLLCPSILMAGDLTVKVGGLKNSAGSIRIALHDGEAGFPNKRAPFAAQARKSSQGGVRFVFTDLEPGSYAVSLFHDDNGNGKRDVNLVGLPIEGYGFSNNATGTFGPASFADARFEMPAADLKIAVTVSY